MPRTRVTAATEPAPSPAITYTWTIAQLDCAVQENTLSQVVKTVHWHLHATDGTNTVEMCNTLALQSPDPDAFTAYEALTEADVIGWIENELPMDQLRLNIAEQLERLANPPIVAPKLPWL
jgi:hypothetical protein